MTRGLRMGAGRGRWQSRSLCNTWWLVGLVRGSVRAWILTFALTILSLGAHAAELTDVRFSAQPGNRVEIQLIFSAPVQAPSAFDTISPARIALDFPGVGNRLDRRAVPIGVGAVHSLVAVQSSDRARVVINLNDPVPYQVAVEGNLVRVELDTQAGVAGPSPGTDSSTLPATRPDPPSSTRPRAAGGDARVADPAVVSAAGPGRERPGPALRDVDFRRGPDGEGRILIKLPSAQTRVTLREEGTRVKAEVLGTSLPQRLFRRLDVTDFGTPVQAVEARPRGRDVEINIQTDKEFEYMAYQTDDLLTVELRALTPAERERRLREKVVYDGERLSLNFQEIDVRAVLQLLADFTDQNLVTSDAVGGNLTLRLKNVPWDQALDIILKTKNLAMRRDGNVMMVGPFEEIIGREELALSADQRIEELAPIQSEFIQVKFAKAADIAAFIGGASSSVETRANQFGTGPVPGPVPDWRSESKSESTTTSLSKDSILTPGRGSVTFDERTNSLLVMDTASRLDEIRRVVAMLDVPVRQVMIESRVVIANNDFARDLGVRLGLGTSMGSLGSNEMLIGGGLPGNLSGMGDYNAGPFGLSTDRVSQSISFDNTNNTITISETTTPGQPFNSILQNPAGVPSLLVNLPVLEPSGAVNFLIGKVGSYLLQLELSAMQREGRGEVVSSPRVITSDQKEATIEVGKRIPYATVSERGTEVQFEDAALSLKVTPAITPDERIILDLKVNKDEPDFTSAVDGVPSINKREIKTQVLVDNGETVVLGGVYERTRTFGKEQVPWLGDVPVLGRLFKRETRSDRNSELLIFVTPKVLKADVTVR